VETNANGNLVPDTRAHVCIQDMQDFSSENPHCTVFDQEAFLIGWQAGAKWAGDTACKGSAK
jgi:hypothetical protein